jgi:hypothetical protein
MDMDRLAIWAMGVIIGVLLRECFEVDDGRHLDE